MPKNKLCNTMNLSRTLRSPNSLATCLGALTAAGTLMELVWVTGSFGEIWHEGARRAASVYPRWARPGILCRPHSKHRAQRSGSRLFSPLGEHVPRCALPTHYDSTGKGGREGGRA